MAALAFFGELIVRLSPPGRQLLALAQALDVFPGGAEANVAVALAGLGHDCRMISRVPDNGLGDMALRPLMAAGIDCGQVSRGPGRMAFYWMEQGAGTRASRIVYDREGSALALSGIGDFDWDSALAGVEYLYLSGITPALGSRWAEDAVAVARLARERGVRIVFDGNYRANLWAAWDSDPRSVLRALVGEAEILFGNHRDLGLLLGREFAGDDMRREAALEAFAAFPGLRLIAGTRRQVEHVDSHRLSARIDTPVGYAVTGEMVLHGIVERVGGGDAFAAGVLHGLLTQPGDIEAAARTGLALTALKHSVPGDAVPFRQADIDQVLTGELDVRR